MLLNRLGLRASVVSAMLGLAVAIPAAAQNVAAVSATPRIRIDNFGKINANYYRGAQPKGRDYADLAALGVKTVIDLTDDDGEASEPTMVKSAGMQSIKIPMNGHVPPTAAQLAQFLKIVNDPASQPVYVHCVGGKHRTGVMTAAYRMARDGWTPDKAFSEMKQYKFGMDVLHPEFKRFVYSYKPEPKGSVPTVIALTAQP
jgi:tyrosine-protein phosphatase SIW14